MKHKYVLRNSLYLDEELQDYFNEMSKKGWRLDFIGYYYRFSKDEHVYKYQIDYTPISSEYQDILKEMGCKWASKKKQWFYRPEEHKSRWNRKEHSIEEIREMYGTAGKRKASGWRRVEASA